MLSTILYLVRIIFAAGMGWYLNRRFGLFPSLLMGALLASMFGTCGYWLLKVCSTDEISWKNYVAGWLIPWGYQIAPNSLVWIACISTIVWSCLFGLGSLIGMNEIKQIDDEQSLSWTRTSALLLLASWVVYGAAILFLINRFATDWDASKPPGFSISIAMAILVIILVVSLGCKLNGYPLAALLVAGVPLLVASLWYAVLIGGLLLGGSRGRWN